MSKYEDRGMMKYAPYQSLIEQSASLRKLRYNKNKKEKPAISNERAEEINSVLTNYDNENVIIRFYEDGYLYYIEGKIEKIEPMYRYLLIREKKIEFKNLIEIVIKN